MTTGQDDIENSGFPNDIQAKIKEDLAFLASFDWRTMHHKRAVAEIVFAAYSIKASHAEHNAINNSLYHKELQTIKRALAANPNTSGRILEYLADECCDENVLERIAENPNTPISTLNKLSTHESVAIRQALSDNENTPIKILEALADDESDDVRLRLAENPYMPLHILDKLAQEENIFISLRAKRTISRLQTHEMLMRRLITGPMTIHQQLRRHKASP